MIAMITWMVPAVAQPTDDEAKIRALENQFVAAVNGKDLDAIMKVYMPDETLLVFDVVPPANTSAPRRTARIEKTSPPCLR